MKAYLVLAAACLWSGSIAAQQKPVLQVLVENPGENAIRCGITKSGIESIAILTLRNNGVQVTLADMETHLYVTVTALKDAGGCVINAALAVRTVVPMASKGIGGFRNRRFPNLAVAPLCESQTLFTTPQGPAATRFDQILESDIKRCLGELEY